MAKPSAVSRAQKSKARDSGPRQNETGRWRGPCPERALQERNAEAHHAPRGRERGADARRATQEPAARPRRRNHGPRATRGLGLLMETRRAKDGAPAGSAHKPQTRPCGPKPQGRTRRQGPRRLTRMSRPLPYPPKSWRRTFNRAARLNHRVEALLRKPRTDEEVAEANRLLDILSAYLDHAEHLKGRK